MEFNHFTVMKKEVVDALGCENSGKIYIDCTLGGAGHTREILDRISPQGLVIGFDVDTDAIEAAQERLKDYKNVKIINSSYKNLEDELKKQNIKKITGGIIFDLGASYHQLTTAERGFSFMKDAPLDMRFDKSQKTTASEIVNKYKEEHLVEIFSKYGEERFSKRIAKAIIKNRPINTTFELSELIVSSTPRIKSKIHPATRVFQALRIETNQELLNFENTLKKAITLCDINAIICVLSFHSLEDKIVKNTFKSYLAPNHNKYREDCGFEGRILEVLTKKPLTASEEELKINPPSRSAKLRVARVVQ